jgi:transcriptional regulator with XRE-family HTH domain
MEDRGKRLKLARIAAGLSQTELAKKLGVSTPTVSNREIGATQVTDEIMRTTAIALGLEENELFDPLVCEPPTSQARSQAAQDLEELVRALASKDPDLVTQFRTASERINSLSDDDKAFLADMFRLALGRITKREVKDITDTL